MLIPFMVVLIIILISLSKFTHHQLDKAEDCFENGFLVSFSRLPNFSKNTEDYKEYYPMIDNIARFNRDQSIKMLKGNKVSLKIRQLGSSRDEQLERFLDIVKYAEKNQVFVWISCVLPVDRQLEMNAYELARNNGYSNVGITLATYHSDVLQRIKKVLDMNGHIRLVKGYYYGNLSSNWDIVTDNYIKGMHLLVKNNKYHCIATHDFNILSEYQELKGKDNLEVSFFYKAKDFVLYEIHRRRMKFKQKSFYVPAGPLVPYLSTNFYDLDKKRILMRELNGLLVKVVLWIREMPFLGNLNLQTRTPIVNMV